MQSFAVLNMYTCDSWGAMAMFLDSFPIWGSDTLQSTVWEVWSESLRGGKLRLRPYS
jgi:hypothetical protein